MLLAVYVDDFKMAGPEDNMDQAWKLLREGKDPIIMDDPAPLGGYLGCTHIMHYRETKGKRITAIEYDMQGQLEQSLELYKSLTGIIGMLPIVPTPSLEDDDVKNPARHPSHIGKGLMCPWCRSCYPRSEYKEYENTNSGGRKREKEHTCKHIRRSYWNQ